MGFRISQTHQMLASATRTTGSGQSNTFRVEDWIEALLFIDVTAVAGAGILTATFQGSYDGTSWFDLPGGSFTAMSSASKATKAVTNFGKYVRLSYTITGTSVTFSVNFVGKI